MDVVLTPTGASREAWSLKDRLGRSLGRITKPQDSAVFEITPEPQGLLAGVQVTHPSLRDAMSAIAKLTNGACTLDSEDWISRGRGGRPG